MESLYPFPEGIITHKRSIAMQIANDIYNEGIIERRLVIWVDGSAPGSPAAADRLVTSAVTYLDWSSKTWTELITLNTLKCGARYSEEAEMIAIQEAFRVACNKSEDFDHLIILSDCLGLLEGLKRRETFTYFSRPELRNSLVKYANILYDLGIIVELRWVPAHEGIEGNERADTLATVLRRSVQSMMIEHWPGLTLQDVTITPCSAHSMLQDIFAKLADNDNDVDMDDDANYESEEALIKKPDNILQDITITPCSADSLRQVMFTKLTNNEKGADKDDKSRHKSKDILYKKMRSKRKVMQKRVVRAKLLRSEQAMANGEFIERSNWLSKLRPLARRTTEILRSFPKRAI
ncbi:hypothetical protein BT63DRAFT_458536 [Microthyrium microscopicum]|uniref:RNase H type-1 domain-containing protein n=1 Tax=Microthyrium microscopicum TaxID=703497 RepID=A0A6A6U4G1_9PEZI|nr:hypothetical protein BT63DRAFT_458536 [Microthyrium microscopicum]